MTVHVRECCRLIVMALPKGQCDRLSCYCGNVAMYLGGLNVSLFAQDLGKNDCDIVICTFILIGFR